MPYIDVFIDNVDYPLSITTDPKWLVPNGREPKIKSKSFKEIKNFIIKTIEGLKAVYNKEITDGTYIANIVRNIDMSNRKFLEI